MKIGFFGGCFNPPTNAHIALAKSAIDKFSLDKVIFVPMGDTFKKEGLAKAEDRLNMLKIATDGEENLEVSDIEIKEKKDLYAIDAFRLLENTYPDCEKYFLMGADNFIKIMEWKESEALSKYNYIVFERENIEIKENSLFLNVHLMENNEYKNKSSSMFRKLLKENEKDQDIVCKEVLDYIIKNNIYNQV